MKPRGSMAYLRMGLSIYLYNNNNNNNNYNNNWLKRPNNIGTKGCAPGPAMVI